MKIEGQAALVTGGASGLGEATARELARLGAKVAVLDVNIELAEAVARDIDEQYGNGCAVACRCDITDTGSLQAALDKAAAAHGPARILMNIAGIGTAKRVVGKDGNPAPLEDFVRVLNINLVGTYNASRLFAAACAKLPPLEDGERGVMMFTASAAAFDGQVGQQAYSASKGGLVGMTLPMAQRGLAQVLRQLQAGGMSILLVEHDMDLVMEVCDRLVVMEFGTLLMEGTPREVQQSPAVRAAYLGTEH